MRLLEPLPATDHALLALVQDATAIMCEELEARCGVRSGAGPARHDRLGPAAVARPALCWRCTVDTDSGHSLAFGIVIRERDSVQFMSEGNEPPMLGAMAEGLRRVLETRTCLSWGEPHIETAKNPANLYGVGTELDTATVSLMIDGVQREICFVALPGTMELFHHLEGNVVVALRPRLVDTQIAPEPPAEVDERILNAIPLRVDAVLSTESVSVGRVAGLRVGDALRISDDWSRLVRLSVGNRVIARGELVVVGGRWGVLVHEVGGEG